MARCKKSIELGGLDDSLGRLFEAQLAFGREALSVIGSGGSSLVGSLLKGLPAARSCCDIPEPCWMPKDLGEICCEICPGDTGEICLVISNEDFKPRDYLVHAQGEHGNLAAISDQQFTLGSKERKLVSVKFKMPAGQIDQNRRQTCCECNDYEVLIWIEGCSNHFLRWYLNTGEKHRKCCHEICVIDQPDYELHWYDHFHAPQPCFGPITSQK